MLDPTTVARLGRMRQEDMRRQAARERLYRQARRQGTATSPAGLVAVVQRVAGVWHRLIGGQVNRGPGQSDVAAASPSWPPTEVADVR
jgi:hypothetical protein